MSERDYGLTVVLDRLSGLVKEEFHEVAKYVSIVLIGWGLPLVWSEDALESRIRFYQDEGVKVAMSGMLIEKSFQKTGGADILARAKSMGFDMVEISDGIVDLSALAKVGLVSKAKSLDLEVLYTVGKKDPSAQLSINEMLACIQGGLRLDPFKVVIEGRERGRGVGIYDSEGNIKWPVLRAITSTFDHRKLIFEAPSETQQEGLILELGPRVNLGHVPLGSIATVQSERMGLRFDTFGIDRPLEKLAAGPSVKFVLYAIRNHQPIDQKGIVGVTQLPRRTVQKALENLLDHGLITGQTSFEDRRSKLYRASATTQQDEFR
jgi:phosphosulfolactate synthase